jgi:hypothetical protein
VHLLQLLYLRGLRLVLLIALAAFVVLVVKLALTLGFVGLGRPAVGVSVNIILPVLGCSTTEKSAHPKTYEIR